MRQIKMWLPITDNRQPITRRKAFTLIELLVVIAIIGILATIVIFNVIGAQAKARDAKRMSDLNSIAKAIQLFRESKGTYALTELVSGVATGGANNAGYGFFNCDSDDDDCAALDIYTGYSLNKVLIDTGYLGGIVKDPKNKFSYTYDYPAEDGTSKGSIYCVLENVPIQSEIDLMINNSANECINVGCALHHEPAGVSLGTLNYAVTLIP